MKKIHILSPGYTSPNSCAFLYPLAIFRHAFKDTGYDIKIFTKRTESLTDCDALLIEHKAITKQWDPQKSLDQIAAMNEKTTLIWCDQSDSSGTFLGQILPYVSKYLKSQTLTDKTLYKQRFYADRIYTDYYHNNNGIKDDQYYDFTPATNDEECNKIGLSWNSGLMHHGFIGPYLNRFLQHAPFLVLPHFAKTITPPQTHRTLDIACRMGISYPRATVRFQREQLKDILKAHISSEKLSRKNYFKELSNCKICISPFGYGEITLKDFECFLTGGLLMKPDMDHMETWPNFYEKDKTYIAHNWDLSDVLERIEHYKNNKETRLAIAEEAQKRYNLYTTSPEAPALFIQQFQAMLQIPE